MDNSIAKAFGLLEMLASSDEPLGVTALAEQASLGKSNVHRILQSLVELGYVEKNAAARYLPTTRLWEFGSQVMSRRSVRDVARPAMRLLAELTSETVHLSELHDGDVLYIDKIESSEPVRTYTQLGGRAPAYCTATGKAMLAFVAAERMATILESAVAHNAEDHHDLRAVHRRGGEDQNRVLRRQSWRVAGRRDRSGQPDCRRTG